MVKMNAGIIGMRLPALIEPHHPKAGLNCGRLAMPPENMLPIFFLKNWYALSYPIADETLYDRVAMRWYAGIVLGDDGIPDESTMPTCQKRTFVGSDVHGHGVQIKALISSEKSAD